MATIQCNNPVQGPDVSPGPQVTVSGIAYGDDVRLDWYAITDASLLAFQNLPCKTSFSGNTLTFSVAATVPYGQEGKVWVNVFAGNGALQGQSNQRDVNRRIPPAPPVV